VSMCGANVTLCLPRSRRATSVQSRPSTRPSASSTCHDRVSSAAFGEYVRTSLSLSSMGLPNSRARRRGGQAAAGRVTTIDAHRAKRQAPSFVGHRQEAQPLWRGGCGEPRALPGPKVLDHVCRAAGVATRLHEDRRDRTHHLVAERLGGDVDADEPTSARDPEGVVDRLDGHVEDAAHDRLVGAELARAPAEGPEVVLPQPGVGRLGHRAHVQGPRRAPRDAVEQGRAPGSPRSSGNSGSGRSTWATWPSAWTPASVRPAQTSLGAESRRSTMASTSASAPATVTVPGWAAKPWNSCPRYARSSRQRRWTAVTSDELDARHRGV